MVLKKVKEVTHSQSLQDKNVGTQLELQSAPKLGQSLPGPIYSGPASIQCRLVQSRPVRSGQINSCLVQSAPKAGQSWPGPICSGPGSVQSRPTQSRPVRSGPVKSRLVKSVLVQSGLLVPISLSQSAPGNLGSPSSRRMHVAETSPQRP